MSTPPPPPERQSMYPEPHRSGDWPADQPHVAKRRKWPLLAIAAGVAAIVGLAVLGVNIGRERGTAPVEVTDPGGQTINALQVDPGTCVADLPENGEVARVTAVPCFVPHHAEAIAAYTPLSEGWPGRDAVAEEILSYCGGVIQPGFGMDAMFQASDWQNGLRWVAWIPTEESWAAGERTGVCVVHQSGDIAGSFIAGGAAFID